MRQRLSNKKRITFSLKQAEIKVKPNCFRDNCHALLLYFNWLIHVVQLRLTREGRMR